MSVSEYRDMQVDQLNEEILKLRKEQFALRMQSASGQLGQPHLMKDSRRNIARLKTVLAEKRNHE
jgi:large subunit ribosomal protein L29